MARSVSQSVLSYHHCQTVRLSILICQLLVIQSGSPLVNQSGIQSDCQPVSHVHLASQKVRCGQLATPSISLFAN